MKKLLCLVFVLIAVLGLAFAVSAAEMPEATIVSNRNNSMVYQADGEIPGRGQWNEGATGGGTFWYHWFDGNTDYSKSQSDGGGAAVNNLDKSYLIIDLNSSLAGGYFVTQIKIFHKGNTSYSLYYTADNLTWETLASNTTTTGEFSYAVNKKVLQVKYVFENKIAYQGSLAEIQVFGIDPADMPCTHEKLSDDAWKIVEGTGSCTTVPDEAQVCSDCNETVTRKAAKPLGHIMETDVTKPGTNISYGEGTIRCVRNPEDCQYAIDFHGEVKLTDEYYFSINESTKFVNATVSSIADKWGGSNPEFLFNDTWSCYEFNSWFAASYEDTKEWLIFDFKGELDLTKIDIMVPNDSQATLLIWAMNEDGEYEIVKELPTYDEALGELKGSNGIRLVVPMLGIRTKGLKIQVISDSNWGPGYIYQSMVIAECHVYGIAPGCGLDATNHECVFDTFVGYAENSAPTCQRVGKAVYQCTCNNQETREVQPSEEFHNYIEVEGTRVNSTCTVAGSYTGTCEYCEDTKEFELELDNETGHNYEETGRTDATCIAVGSIEYKCSACEATKSEEIALVDHAYGEAVVVPSTCTVAGTSTVTCSACGNEKVTALDLAAHAYDVETEDPTCEATGLKTSTCVVCGDVQEEVIKELGHTWEIEDYNFEPSCNEAGEANFVCSECGDTKTDVVPATGNHNYDMENIEVVAPPTCQLTGYGTVTCEDCGATKTVVIDTLAHDFSVEVERKEPTCEETGYIIFKCSNANCPIQPKTETLPVLGHDCTEATCKEPATCKREGCTYKGTELAAHTWGNVACTAGNCVVCGAENPDAEKVAHTYGWKIPVKNEEGEIVKYIHGCSVCLLEAKEDTDAEGKGLGYSTTLGDGLKIYYVSTWNEFKNKVNLSDAAVVRFTDNATTSAAQEVKNGNVIIDLGGYSVTSTAGSATFHLNYAKGLVNGTLFEGGAKQAVSVRTAEFIKDFVIEVLPTAGDCSGIIIFPGRDGRKAYLGSIENVTITAKNNGIETYETITGVDTAIGTIDGVTVTTQGQALTLYSNVGLIKNSSFTGKNFAVIFKYLNGTVEFQNCTLSGDNACLYVNDIKNNAKLVVDSATTFATKGLLFYATEEHKEAVDFGMLETAKAAVNGRLYATFAEAFAAFEASDKDVTDFALMADLELSSSIKIEKNVNFSLGGGKFEFVYEGTKKQETKPGYTVSIPNDTKGNGVFLVMPTGTLTISGNGVVNAAGNSANGFNIAIWVYGGQATIEGGTYTNEDVVGDDAQYDLIYVNNGGKLLVTGGTFKCKTPQWTLNMGDNSNSEIVVKDGIFYGYDPSKSNTEPNGPVSFVSEEVICVYENADGAYVLASKHLHDHTSQQTNTGCAHTDVAATCTESAYRTHTCPCGDVRIETTGEPTGHKWVDATCLAPKTCSVCNETEGEVLPHNYVPVVNEDGSTTYTCQNGCDDSYVINNAAINGTYYDDMDTEYVFANGKLTAMGSEFTYTYNVTTGMVELQETTKVYFFVINGTLCSRTRMPLHKHDKSSLIKEITAPTCTEKGYTTYICPISGPLFNDDYVDATGHSYGSMKVEPPTCTEDGYLQITCRTCEKTFVSPSPETDAYIDSLPSFITITIKPATGHTAAEAVREKVQNATCTAAGSYESVVYCSVCDAEISRTTETIAVLGHTPGEEVIENNKPATSTTAGSYDKVVYCVTCKEELSRETVTVEPTCKHETTEIIPAVLPTPKVQGYTAGVKCLDCEKVIEEPKAVVITEMADVKDANFRVASASLSLEDSIIVNYKNEVKISFTKLHMVFVFNGKEYVYTDYYKEASSGRYVFGFDELLANQMVDNIEAYVYAETAEGEYSMNKILEYSVTTYCVNQLKKSIDNKFRTVISDLLVMGSKTQVYSGYKVSSLAYDVVAAEGYSLTPSTYTGFDASENIQAVTGDRTTGTDWKGASLELESRTVVNLKFETDSTEGLVIKVKVGNSAAKTFDATKLKMDGNRYVVVIDYLTAKQFNAPITATFERNGEQVGSTIHYSVNTYVCRNAENASLNAKTKELIKAIYVYGKSVEAYFGK